MSTTSDDEIVELAMPKGQTYDLPSDWAEELRTLNRKESPSSIRSFCGCPMRWYLERYSDLPGQPSGWPAVVGSFVHRVLEVFYTEPAEERTQELLDRVFKEAWFSIKSNDGSGIIDEGLQSDFDILRNMDDNVDNPGRFFGGFYKRARACVDAIIDFDGEDLSQVDVVDTERWVRMKSNGILIRGKIDRTVNHPVDGVVIHDYKTGKLPGADEEQGLCDSDGNLILDQDGNPILLLGDAFMAMGLYALMTSKGSSFDGRDAMKVTAVQLLYLFKNVKYNVNIKEHTLQLVQTFVDHVTAEMNQVVESGKITLCKADSPDSGQCGWCPASGICPAWTGESNLDDMRERLGL